MFLLISYVLIEEHVEIRKQENLHVAVNKTKDNSDLQAVQSCSE